MTTRDALFEVRDEATQQPFAEILVTFDDQGLGVVSVSGSIQGTPITGLSGYLNSPNKLETVDARPGGSGVLYSVNFDDVSMTAGGIDYNFVGKFGGPRLTGEYVTVNASNGTIYEASTPNLPSYFVSSICFASGTRIKTLRGEIAVEHLILADSAVTATGGVRPVRWIGRRQLRSTGEPLPFEAQPIRVRAGAFGPGLPVRDLSLSPGHPVLVGADADNEGGVLVPVMCLINGTSITREAVSAVTYWHVELDAHDILLAEGLPVESYIDGGDRAFFVEASDHALHNPDFVAPGWNARCRPVAVDGALVEAERARLDAVFASALCAQAAWDADEPAIWAR